MQYRRDMVPLLHPFSNNGLSPAVLIESRSYDGACARTDVHYATCVVFLCLGEPLDRVSEKVGSGVLVVSEGWQLLARTAAKPIVNCSLDGEVVDALQE